MSRGWGRALIALGGGLNDWAGEMSQRRERQQSVDSQLASRGYFRREPKTAMASGGGMMESAVPQSDPMLDAIAQGGGGRSLMPGMRPQPLSATMGMDVDFGDVGPENPSAYAPDTRPAEAQPPSVRPGPERLMALKSAIRNAAPKDYSETMEFEGGMYEYDPERTPEGRRSGLQAALQRQQQQAAYASWLRNNPGRNVAFEAVDDWQAVNREGLRADTRAAEPSTINVGGRRFPDTPQGQAAAIAWDRALNPPRETGGGGGGGGGGMTPTQERTQRRREAAGRAQTLAAEAYARGSRLPNGARNDVVGFVRNYLRQEFPDIPEAEIQGIAATQVRINEPRDGGGGGSRRLGSRPLF